ncbi:glycosyltransferase [Hydrogenophaga sp.]|uniref:glycosyltransferase family 2 protein n=1 Tax=Hydrogenophaga sp. TaxID=1904254 RepID=UPI002634E892|nr:glycosyltransferase [Hydrogenophaga sp.]MDM7950745.1 glycosyltransferase [Hydrogenophaga sp.]
MRIEGISVVVTSFNGEAWIRAAIVSILEQDLACPVEVIVIDDGSIDSTVSIIQSLDDARVQLIQNSTNLGTAKSRNVGIQRARHQWIAFNDQDDVWLPHKLSRQCEIIEDHPEIDGVAGGYARLAKDGLTRWTGRVFNKLWSPCHTPALEEPPYYFPARHGTCYVQSLLVCRNALQLIGGFRENLPIAYDPDLIIRLGEVIKLAALEEPVFLYRLSHTSITGAANLNTLEFLSGFAYIYAAQEARASGQHEPDMNEFIKNYKPGAREIEQFKKSQILRNINTCWINDGLFYAMLTACQQVLRHPSLIGMMAVRMRWWKKE